MNKSIEAIYQFIILPSFSKKKTFFPFKNKRNKIVGSEDLNKEKTQ